MDQVQEVQTALGTLAIFERGAGKPILLWPSLFTDHSLYDAMTERLSALGWRTLSIDGPGFGKSDPPDGLVQPEAYANAVIEVADRLGMDRFAFAGCSWGGMIGAHLGVNHAERLGALVLMNTPMLPSRGGHRMEYWGARLAVTSSHMADGVAKDMLGKRALADSETFARFTAPFASFERAPAARTVDVTLRHSDGLEQVLPRLTHPVTIMFGADDELYPTDEMMPVAKSAPAARIVVVPDCGHIIPIEEPEAAVAAIVEADAQQGSASNTTTESNP